MEHSVNEVTLRGQLHSMPVFSHENHGRRFFRFLIEVSRLSGTVDLLPVIAQDLVLDQIDLSGGEHLTVTGQIRSHNIRTNGTRHLMIFVFASKIYAEDGECINEVTLQGPICKAPIYRKTPLGRQICDVMLAVPRAFQRADYLPCIMWGRTALEIASCSVGQWITVTGRLQSRIYTKLTEDGPKERTAYEISCLSAAPTESETDSSL